MSLLQDALRRQAEQADRPAVTPPAPPAATGVIAPPAVPAAATSVIAPTTAPVPEPPDSVETLSASPATEHPAGLFMPFAMLLLVALLAWLALRQRQTDTAGANSSTIARHDAAGATTALPAPAPEQPQTITAGLPPATAASTVTTNLPTAPDASVGAIPAVAAEETATVVVTLPITNPVPASITAVAPAAAPPPPWPLFTVRGFAVSGHEALVVLDSGEMLAAGERSRLGVRVIRVTRDHAWFEWHGQTNALRRGTSSDHPPEA